MSIVHVMNRKTPKDKQIMNLLRKLVTRSIHYNIVFEAQHIQGLQNVIADKLSRFQLQDLRPSWTKTEQTSD
jgi:ribosomal protein S3AE